MIVLDDPEADILSGYAAGYAARILLSAEPREIALLIQKVLDDSRQPNKETLVTK